MKFQRRWVAAALGMASLGVGAISPVQANVRIQCRDFHGEAIFEFLFPTAPAFSDETVAPWEEFATHRERFVPGPALEVAWGDLQRLSGISHLIQRRFLRPRLRAVNFAVDPTGGLRITLDATTASLQILVEQFYVHLGDEVYYGANEWEEDGGFLFARAWLDSEEVSLEHSKLLCAVNIQGQPIHQLPIHWRAGTP